MRHISAQKNCKTQKTAFFCTFVMIFAPFACAKTCAYTSRACAQTCTTTHPKATTAQKIFGVSFPKNSRFFQPNATLKTAKTCVILHFCNDFCTARNCSMNATATHGNKRTPLFSSAKLDCKFRMPTLCSAAFYNPT